MAAPRFVSVSLETLVCRRNELAHGLANASERERATQWYLDREELMNSLTLEIERRRRESHHRPALRLCVCANSGSLDPVKE